MEGTTISVSEKFHDMLKSKGMKDESYESIILRMLKIEFLKDYKEFQKSKKMPLRKEAAKPNKIAQTPAAKPKKLDTLPAVVKSKPLPNKALKRRQQKKPKRAITVKMPKKKFPKAPGAKIKDGIKQWKYGKNLELQDLKTQLGLAKLSNDAAKISELAVSIAKLKEELEQK
ncbi:MAG: hypothetical protein AABX33_02265 [Nanoarchaeota archaeon]